MTAGANRSRSVLSVILLSALTLLAFTRLLEPLRGRVTDRLDGLDEAGGRMAAPVNRATGKALSYDELKKENARLVAELDTARKASLLYADALRERKELLALNGFVDPDGYTSISARINGSALNNYDETVRIDRGSKDGVRVDYPVVSAAGLVGRVISVSPSNAQVQLVTDPVSSIGVRFARTGEVAIARGRHAETPLELDLVSMSVEVSKGDVVVTSGLQDSRYPPGIAVARVASVKPGAIQQEVTATPVVDLARIEFVKVLIVTDPS